MTDYLTTETVTYEYDTSGRVNKVTTITTEGPDDRAPAVQARAEGGVVTDMGDFRVHRSGHRQPSFPRE